ncbi:methyltransferase domain-containing protein [Ferrovibrio sp.]|jgi:predicted TPR repeat methyltransferase|uniref:methyltransferase domain-containing protein n=1 Tax=Ferrovibrio sp. TaxID=1917215 RepID=UPI0035B2690E
MQHDATLDAISWQQRGIRALENGRHAEAEGYFSKAVTLADSALSWLGLAMSQIDLKRNDAAVKSLQRAQKLSPQSGVINHLLASLEGRNPERAPAVFVNWLFNNRAASFDTHLSRLAYRGPEMLQQLAINAGWAADASRRIVDLGCGTGLSGVPFRPYASRLDGVDMVPGMLQQAQRRGIYDALQQSELHAALETMGSDAYDVAIAADTLIYVGKLDGLFVELDRVLASNGSILFTTELGATGSGYTLLPTGRYSHAEDYLLACAGDRFRLEDRVDGCIRVEDGRMTAGCAYRFTKV